MDADSPQSAPTGALDLVTPDGIVEGWCWSPAFPDQRREVTILVDGRPVGEALAARYREDLRAAKIGDGHHAFRFVLPWSTVGQQRSVCISIRDADTGEPVGEPFNLHQRVVATIDDRISEIERKLRLLQSRSDDLARRTDERLESAGGELFRTIGRFFEDLADDVDHGAPMHAIPRLGLFLKEVTGRHSALTLQATAFPLATLCVDACTDLAGVVECLAELHRAGLDGVAAIVVLDRGEHDDVALITTVVRGLRYLRVGGSGVLSELNELALEGETPSLIFMAAHGRPQPGWVETVAATLEAAAEAAVVAGCVVRGDGVIHHAGLFRTPAGEWCDYGAGRLDGDVECSFVREVDAAGAHAVAFRKEALEAIGGFDIHGAGVANAVADACVRLRLAGRTVIYQPLARCGWSGPGADDDRWIASGREPAAAGADRLAGDPSRADPSGIPVERHALFLPPRAAEDLYNPAAALPAMLVLQSLGYRVTWLRVYPAGFMDEARRTLARIGVRTLSASQFASVAEYLRECGGEAALVYLPEPGAAEAADLSQLAPNAMIVTGDELSALAAQG